MTESMTGSTAEPNQPVVIAGGSGFIGRRLAAAFAADDHPVTILTRRPSPTNVGNVRFVTWDPNAPGDWTAELEGAAAVINLCGESIAGPRWSDARKQALVASRVDPTKTLVRAINDASTPPDQLLQASGVGYYGTGAGPFTEKSKAGGDFLAELAEAWEASLTGLTVRHSVLRLGVVLGRRGGPLPQMLAPFRFFVGGPIASGNQWLSWIHLQDVIGAMRHLIFSEPADTPRTAYNVTAPNPIRNHEFAGSAARLLKRPNVFPIPRSAMRLLLGEQATLVCDGQQALPAALQASGFEFRYPDIDSALENLIG